MTAAPRWRWAAAGLLVIGLALMAFKIWADSEPGALPLGLVLLGAVGLFVTRRRR